MTARRVVTPLVCLVLAAAWAVGCGSDGGSSTGATAGAGGDGQQALGGTESGQGSGATTAGGQASLGGNEGSGDGGLAGEAPLAGAAGMAPQGPDHGELLFAPASADATADGDLFLAGMQLYWRYELDGMSFIATGLVSGGEHVDLVEAAEPISVFDVRESLVYQTGGKVFVHPRSATPLTPVELTDAPTCVALSSAAGNVYCRSDAGSIVRWPDTGGAGTVIATNVPPGASLVADAAPPLNKKLLFCEDAGNVSSIPIGGFAGGPLEMPSYQQINKQQAAPRSLHVGVPGDDVLYWLNAPEGMPARVRGSAKTTAPATSAGPALDSTRVFTPYSWGAGAIIAIDNADDSAQLAYVRFAQTFITQHYVSQDGVVALAAEAGRYYWLDRKARVFVGAFKP